MKTSEIVVGETYAHDKSPSASYTQPRMLVRVLAKGQPERTYGRHNSKANSGVEYEVLRSYGVKITDGRTGTCSARNIVEAVTPGMWDKRWRAQVEAAVIAKANREALNERTDEAIAWLRERYGSGMAMPGRRGVVVDLTTIEIIINELRTK